MLDHPNSKTLLTWYDDNARVLPWRVAPADRKLGQMPDPYRIWLSEIMLQQTTVAAVKAYFVKFTTLWPNVFDLAAADDAEVMAAWAGLGYYARARNLLKCARAIVVEFEGQFPSDRDQLQGLPGIGPYTSAALASIAFDQPETVVDGNVERVMARLFDVHLPLPKAKVPLTKLAEELTPHKRAGDYAQAVMDLGATICTSKSPSCKICPWRCCCLAMSRGTARELPKKSPKAKKPTRQGIAYVARRTDGAVLLEQRPDRGLLGGMLGWPVSDWTKDPPEFMPPFQADWVEAPEEVCHTFTHFHLRLRVMVASVLPERSNRHFIEKSDFRPLDLPTVMRKVWSIAVGLK
ncbi:MAG: A/G-specific adenine glycosylase [Planktomarina sp.]